MQHQEEEEEEGAEDRLSDLPLPIVHHILSFLPAKDMVATSFLASPWRYLWTSVPNLCFSHPGRLYPPMNFARFVTRFLLRHDASSIVKFCHNSSSYCIPVHLDTWISTLVSYSIQDLTLSFANALDEYVLPECLFTCESLRCLKIFTWRCLINTPLNCLKRIKVLHLESIKFYVENSLQELSLNFPVLEDFRVIGCFWSEIKVVNVCAPTLQSLTLDDSSFYDEPSDCEVNIHAAEHMTSLSWITRFRIKYLLYGLSYLDNAFICVDPIDETVNDVDILLRQISSVRNLKLSDLAVQCLSKIDFSTNLRMLSCLVHLSLDLSVEHQKISVGNLAHILSNVPTVQSLSFPDGLDSVQFEMRDYYETPTFLLPNLKSADFRYFNAKENQWLFVQFLLRSSAKLEKITVTLLSVFYHPVSVEAKKTITEAFQAIAGKFNCAIDILKYAEFHCHV